MVTKCFTDGKRYREHSRAGQRAVVLCRAVLQGSLRERHELVLVCRVQESIVLVHRQQQRQQQQ